MHPATEHRQQVDMVGDNRQTDDDPLQRPFRRGLQAQLPSETCLSCFSHREVLDAILYDTGGCRPCCRGLPRSMKRQAYDDG